MDDSDPSICTSSLNLASEKPSRPSKSSRRHSKRVLDHQVGSKTVVGSPNTVLPSNITTATSTTPPPPPSNYKTAVTLSLAKILLLILAQFPLHATGYPVLGLLTRNSANYASTDTSNDMNDNGGGFFSINKKPVMEPQEYWMNMGISIVLVLLGGVFAGLTLGLMGQDEIYLQVIQQSGEPSEKKAASKVLSLLKRGKHWVLVTLLRKYFFFFRHHILL